VADVEISARCANGDDIFVSTEGWLMPCCYSHILLRQTLARPEAARLELGGIETGVGLGDGEAGLLGAFDERLQKAVLLLFGAEYHHGIEPEDVHVQRRGPREGGARLGHRLHHDRGFRDAEPGAAIGLRHGDAEPAAVGNGAVEGLRKFPVAVAIQPVILAETGTDLQDCLTDFLLDRGEGEIHGGTPGRTSACWVAPAAFVAGATRLCQVPRLSW
jgi:hypothetical protein